MERTKGELKFIYSGKHPGDVFVKVKHTKDTFICKFYGGHRGIEAKEQALVNANYFLKSWNAHDKLVEACRECIEWVDKIGRYQNQRLGHGLKKACENWGEASSVEMFDFSKMRAALEAAGEK